jgi:hypothetical protein
VRALTCSSDVLPAPPRRRLPLHHPSSRPDLEGRGRGGRSSAAGGEGGATPPGSPGPGPASPPGPLDARAQLRARPGR